MEINEATKKKLLQNLKDWKHREDESFKILENEIKKAKTVEQLMEYKKIFLAKRVLDLPITKEYCCFCMNYECNKCPYAKHHGECNVSDSDWQIIYNASYMLYVLISRLYYKGEEYELLERRD